jgi:hypothetical protein
MVSKENISIDAATMSVQWSNTGSRRKFIADSPLTRRNGDDEIWQGDTLFYAVLLSGDLLHVGCSGGQRLFPEYPGPELLQMP